MINNQSDKILTVSEVTRSIKTILETEYRFIRISGEVSNLKTPFSGHSYFTLKDSSSQIRGVLFKQQKRFVDLRLEDGMEVICFGRITVYEPRGEYQLIVDSVQLFGVGQLQIEFDRLKKKLSSLGYFDQSIKKPIPAIVHKIAVVSSPTGAAIKDFLKVFSTRKGSAHIQLFPVRVQGKDSAKEIRHALRAANKIADFDVIVLCRGGGSIEDLWSFNDEGVAEEIFKSMIPVLSGIGHEIDFTIADFCADLRCPTPTAAAETLAVDHRKLQLQIQKMQRRLVQVVQSRLKDGDQQIQYQVKLLEQVVSKTYSYEHRLQLSRAYLYQAIENKFNLHETRLQKIVSRLERLAPTSQLLMNISRVKNLKKMLHVYTAKILEKKELDFMRNAALLNSVSPLATLARGYSITRIKDTSGMGVRVLRRSEDIAVGEDVDILLQSGELECRVINIKE